MTKTTIPSFSSYMAPVLYNFVEYKRDSGYKYNSEIKELQRMDRFFIQHDISETKIDEDFHNWLSKRDHESFKTFSLRNSVYRQLYEYTSILNGPSLPAPLTAKDRIMSNGFVPFIFTHEQIKSLFLAIDNETYSNTSFSKNAPLLFRILYGTGLRINEALSLTMADVSPDCTVIVVRDGKSDNSRLVPLSVSLTKRMKEHLSATSYEGKNYIFQSPKGTAISQNSVYDWFRRVLWKAGIPHHGRGKGPRLHDLRHTFAVHSLQHAVESGTDINAFLPVLCTYLGHKRLSATERYLRLTAEVFPEVIATMDSVMDVIVPEVIHHED